MTVNNVSVKNLTNGSLINGTWEGSKVLDVLLKVMNDNIKQEFDKGRIRGADYASVYLGGLQSTIAQAIQFSLGADLANIQIEGEQAKNSAMLAEEIAKLNKEMGYSNAKVSTGEEVWYTDRLGIEHKYDKNTIILGTPDNNGKLDAEISNILKSTDVAERNMFDKETTSVKQRILLDEEKETADLNQLLLGIEESIKRYEHATLQVDKHNINVKQETKLDADTDNVLKSTDVAERNMSDKEATSTKQRILLDEEKETADLNQLLLGIEKNMKQYEHDTLQVDTHNINVKQEVKIDAEIDNTIATKERNDNIAITDIAIKAQQELAEKIKNGDVTVTYKYSYTDANGVHRTNGSGSLQDVFTATDGVITSTVYSDAVGNTPSIYALQKQDIQEGIQEKQQQNRILANKT